MRAPSGTRTPLSMIALRTIAPRPTSTSCSSTDPSTEAWLCTNTPGDRIDRRTVPPEITTPGLTIEASAWPRRVSSSNTNLAGGVGGTQV